MVDIAIWLDQIGISNSLSQWFSDQMGTPELRHRDNIRLDTAAKSTLEWYYQIGCARLQLICK